MGCFVSCFRTKDQEGRPRVQCSDLGPRYHQKGLKEESVVKTGFASVSRNERKEEALGRPCTSDEQLTQEVCLKSPNLQFCETKQLKPSSVIKENQVENFQSTKRIALQELNGSDQCSESGRILFGQKSQLAVQSKPEDSPDQAIPSTPILEKEKPNSSQITPDTARYDGTEETRDCKLDLAQSKNGVRFPVSDPDSPCPTPMILNAEMQTPATTYPLHKGTTITDKQVYATLKPAHQVKISNDSESVTLENKNEVARECSTKMCIEDTPKVVVQGISQCPNGIPNTTTKYKEDQRVQWHATPFEERLERILSDEEMPPARKLISGRLIRLEE